MVQKKPAPISLSVAKKPPKKEALSPTIKVADVVQQPVAKRVIKDKALTQRVTALEAAGGKEIIVKVEAPRRPRITKVAINYDPFGMPTELVPSYSE